MNIDWTKPGWIMVAMWAAGAVVLAFSHSWLVAFFVAVFLVRAYMVYQDPEGR